MTKFFQLASVIALLALTASGLRAEPLKVGDTAPDFQLQGSDGKTYKLSDFKGKKPVVVAWFPKAFTSGCTAECKSMRADGGEIRKYDVAYFTASTDKPEDNKKFAESLELDFPILSDPTGETARAYGIYNNERKVASRVTFYIGKDGKIQAVDQKVQTATAGKDIAAKVKELGASEKSAK